MPDPAPTAFVPAYVAEVLSEKLSQTIDDLKEADDENARLRAELGAVRAELEEFRAFIREHGEVLTGALSSTADDAEGGLFPEHVTRLDAAHSALMKLRSTLRTIASSGRDG